MRKRNKPYQDSRWQELITGALAIAVFWLVLILIAIVLAGGPQ
jgi:hypothetical protein